MQNPAHLRKALDWLAQARKTLQQVYVVQQSEGEPLRAGRVILPGPREKLLEVS